MCLKVAIVGPPLSVLFGGQEIQAAALVDCWRGDPDVTATFVSSRPVLPAALGEVNRIPYLRTAVRFPFYSSDLLSAIKNVDLVHIFAGSFSTFLVASSPAFYLARLLRKKVLIHYHNGRASEHLNESAIARHILRTSDAVVVPSAYLESSFRNHGVCSVVVKNVVDGQQFYFRRRLPLRPRLLCTRNLEDRYGIDVVIRSFATVQSEFPEASLCLAGCGRKELEIRRLVRELALREVQFVGAVHPRAMPALYDQAEIFVNGSYVDGAPVSILEAFCAGLPIATTAAGGIPHLVEHGRTGLLSAPGDWEGLGRNVLRILREPGMAQNLVTQAYTQVREYSWQALRPLWLRIYQAGSKAEE